ncbi:MAG TPA: GntR family transcriptional regulator [Solirubrobacteraceae bacterium]|jgi:DNA-binding GntR family transcriptional regulator
MALSGSARPPTAQAAVLAELRTSILSGRLSPGTQILQNELATEFGVSRAPLRDALRSLEGQGLVRYSSHRGYYVTEIDVEEVAELGRVRQVVETEALRRATAGIDEETIARMSVAMAQMDGAEAKSDWAAWLDAHRAFHFALFEASRRELVVRVLSQLWDFADLYRSYYMRTRQSDSRDRREHESILAAAEARDVVRLVRLMDAHRGGTVESIEASLTDGRRL